jgi:iron complex transport system permease protein
MSGLATHGELASRSGRAGWLVPGLIALTVLLAAISVATGKVVLGWDVFWRQDALARAILLELRLPRTLLAILIGYGLGAAGAAMQGYLRNPLADPGVLGVSSMAALGAVLSMFFEVAGAYFWALPLCAVAGGVIGMLLLFALAGSAASPLVLVLAGVILSAIATAGMALALSMAPSPWASGEIIRWLLGALTDRSIEELLFAAPIIIVGSVLLFRSRSALDALTLGELGARSLGIDLNRAQRELALGVGLIVGACVAVAGVIGFVGLVVPHLLRPLVGARPGTLLLPSALGGAALLLAGDVIVRLLPGGSELQVGVAMSLVGAPFFLALLLSLRRRLA